MEVGSLRCCLYRDCPLNIHCPPLAATHYKCGHVEDDSGGHVFRRESPEEAIQQDRALQEAWAQHPHQIIIPNGDSFQMKLAEATETVLAIARVVHPADYQQAKEISRKRTRKDK